MAEQEKSFEVDINAPEWGLPPDPKGKWGTAEEFRALAMGEKSPEEQLAELRKRVPLAGWRTLRRRLKTS